MVSVDPNTFVLMIYNWWFSDFILTIFFISGHAALTLRSRLRCIILKKDQEPHSNCHPPPTNLLVLNEVVIDRGPSPYLSNIDLYLDGKRITSVQGDGKYWIVRKCVENWLLLVLPVVVTVISLMVICEVVQSMIRLL